MCVKIILKKKVLLVSVTIPLALLEASLKRETLKRGVFISNISNFSKNLNQSGCREQLTRRNACSKCNETGHVQPPQNLYRTLFCLSPSPLYPAEKRLLSNCQHYQPGCNPAKQLLCVGAGTHKGSQDICPDFLTTVFFKESCGHEPFCFSQSKTCKTWNSAALKMFEVSVEKRMP